MSAPVSYWAGVNIMARTVSKTVFQFDELSDSAKESARAWYRDGALDYDWWEFVYSDAAECGKLMGIDLNQKPVKLMSGATRYDPAIWFSGFSSQGDGACFEAYYSYAKGGVKAIKDRAPLDKELHRIAAELQAIQRENFYRLEARTKQRGHYYHSGCMSVDVGKADGSDCNETAETAVTQALRDFADWIYRQLESEHDYQVADEQVDESIRANEYEFDEDGSRA
jgi:hypothetical protein